MENTALSKLRSSLAALQAALDLTLPIPGYMPSLANLNTSPRYPEWSSHTKTKGRRDASLRSRANRRKSRRS